MCCVAISQKLVAGVFGQHPNYLSPASPADNLPWRETGQTLLYRGIEVLKPVKVICSACRFDQNDDLARLMAQKLENTLLYTVATKNHL
jgi:hypothetical protein